MESIHILQLHGQDNQMCTVVPTTMVLVGTVLRSDIRHIRVHNLHGFQELERTRPEYKKGASYQFSHPQMHPCLTEKQLELFASIICIARTMLTESELKILSEATLAREYTTIYIQESGQNDQSVVCIFVLAAFANQGIVKHFGFWCAQIRFEHDNNIYEGDMIEATMDDFMQDNDCIRVQQIKFIR